MAHHKIVVNKATNIKEDHSIFHHFKIITDKHDDSNNLNETDYDEGFSGGMNTIGFCGLNSRLIYDGKTIFLSNSIIECYV